MTGKDRVGRRCFMTGAIAGVFALPSAYAERAGPTHKIVIVHPTGAPENIGDHNPNYRILFDELRRLGYAEGRNLVIYRRGGDGRLERYLEIGREIADLRPDVVFTFGDAVLMPLKSVLRTVPIVGISSEPLRAGLAESLSRPGSNFTGVTTTAGIEVYAKRLQLLHQVAPNVTHVGHLGPEHWAWEGSPGEAIRKAASELRLRISAVIVDAPHDENAYRRAFARMAQSGTDALFVDGSLVNARFARQIVEAAASQRLPAIYPYSLYRRLGGLVVYSSDEEVWREAAGSIDRVLKGENPADLPIRQPMRLALSINLTTAKSLGLSVPSHVLARADEVIE